MTDAPTTTIPTPMMTGFYRNQITLGYKDPRPALRVLGWSEDEIEYALTAKKESTP